MPNNDGLQRQSEDDERYIEGLRERLDSSFRETDRLITSVSTGVLAFSGAFIFTSKAEFEIPSELMISWGAFLGAILFVLVSLFVEQIDKGIRIKNRGFESRKSNLSSLFLTVLNVLSLSAFAIGCIFLFLTLVAR
jgi:hypothetical protein